MRLRAATPRDGARWMLEGLSLLRREPIALPGLFGMVVFALGLVLSLPWIGPVMVAMLLPALTAGWVEAVAAMRAGERPMPSHLLRPLRGPARRALLHLGALHALAAWLLLAVGDLVDPGMEAAWRDMRDSEAGQDATMAAIAALQQGMVLRAALLIPLALTFWHAPVVAVRDGAGAGKALFISATASWRNLGAFVVYGLCWIGADLVLSAVLGAAIALLGLGAAGMMLVLPAAMVFSAAFYASLHATVDGCIDFAG